MYEGTLGVHEVKLVIKSSPGLSDSGGVTQHADGTARLSHISCWWDGRLLVVNTNLETSGTPVNKLDGSLCLDVGDGSVDILGDNISTEEQTTGHVLAVTRVTFHHLVGWLETGGGDLVDRELFMVSFLSAHYRGVGGQREVDTRVGYQVSLELSKIYVQSTVETQRSGDRGYNLTDKSVEVDVARSLNVQVSTGDVIDSLIVHHEGTVNMLQRGVSGQDGVVGLNNSTGDCWGRVDRELELALLAIVY